MNQKGNETFNLETRLRKTFKGLLEAVARVFMKLGLTANSITVLGLLGSLVAGILVALGYPLWAGVTLLVMAPLDAVDGTMARLSGKSTKFGAFLDSFIDRYDELFVFAGVLYWYATQKNLLGIMLCFAAASGAVMVSYARARAEALGYNAKVGVMTRVERAIVMIVGLLFGIVPIALGIIAALAHLTAVLRLFAVKNQVKKEAEKLD